MALESASSLSIAGSSIMEISQAGLPSLLSQIEAELYEGEVYCQVVAQLPAMLGEAAVQVQMMVKAVAKEAIHLAYEHLAGQVRSDRAENKANVDISDSLSAANPHFELNTTQSPILDSTQMTTQSTRSQLAARGSDRTWEEHLRDLGQQLQQARTDRSLSIEELHEFTQVPLHIIVALESGRADRLPEDVYVRGFIRRIGNELGLDGVVLAASLPAPDPVKSVVPSWYRPEKPSGFSLNLIHLYLGYGALMAGALGAVQWIANQTMAKPSLPPAQTIPPPPSDSKHKLSAHPLPIPGLKFSLGGIVPGLDIAPPEFFDF